MLSRVPRPVGAKPLPSATSSRISLRARHCKVQIPWKARGRQRPCQRSRYSGSFGGGPSGFGGGPWRSSGLGGGLNSSSSGLCLFFFLKSYSLGKFMGAGAINTFLSFSFFPLSNLIPQNHVLSFVKSKYIQTGGSIFASRPITTALCWCFTGGVKSAGHKSYCIALHTFDPKKTYCFALLLDICIIPFPDSWIFLS